MRYAEIQYEATMIDCREDAQSFAAWFHGSKVVNPDGSPKRMYHGTGAGDIQAFDIDRASGTALYGPGLYFTDNAEVAGGTGGGGDEETINTKADFQLAGYAFQGRRYELQPLTKKQLAYAKRLFLSKYVQHAAYEDIGSRRYYRTGWEALQAGEPSFREWLANHGPRWMAQKLKVEPMRTTKPTVYPVYLRIRQPFDMNALVDHVLMRHLWDSLPEHVETFENAIAGYRDATTITGGQAWEWFVKRVLDDWHGDGKTRANEVLRQMGYDGMHHTGGLNIGTMGKHEVWIAFHSSQVKSIFAKSYDPTSINIGEANVRT